MSFETDVHCDRCGEGIFVGNIIPKWLMIEKARESGWSMGKYHLCPKCKGSIAKHKREGWLT